MIYPENAVQPADRPEHWSRFPLSGRPLFVILLAVVGGILGDRFLPFSVGASVWFLAATCCFAIWWVGFRYRWPAAWCWLLGCCVFLSAARHHDQWCMYAEIDVATLALEAGEGVPVAVRCRLLTIPEPTPLPPVDPLTTLPRGVLSSFRARIFSLRNGRTWEAATGDVTVRIDGHLLGRSVGDEIEVFGTLAVMSPPSNPGQGDRRLTERSRRTVCRLHVRHPDCVRPMRVAGGWPFRQLGDLRHDGLMALDTYIGPTRAPLAGALLLGARDRLAKDRVDQFFHTGTIHLLAISGLHVGILAWGFFFLARRTAMRQFVLLGLMVGAVVYCYLAGLRSPVMRAAVLIQIVCISRLWCREVSACNALAAAAILILAYQPGALFLPGAQLSFLAVATLIWLSENHVARQVAPIDRVVQQSRSALWRLCAGCFEKSKQLAVAGGMIWIVTLPLVMHWFHLCSPVSLVLNVVLTVPITLGLLAGFGVLLTAPIVSPIASVCGGICDACLASVEAIVGISHELPGAYFWVCGPSAIWCVAFYTGLAVLFLVPAIRLTKRMVLAWLVLWIFLPLAMSWMNVLHPEPPRLRCTFLSVGHGSCVVMELPDQRVVICDAGRMGSPAFGVTVLSEFLWSRSISHVDAIICSHADADHYNLIPGLSERFSIGELLVTPRMLGKLQQPQHTSMGPGVAALQAAIVHANIPLRSLETNDVLRLDTAALRVLHPLPQGVQGSDNANSLVLEATFQNKKILLPGDLESPGLDDVLAEQPRDVDLVMAPHHGSLRSSPHEFANWCTPEVIVISAGRDPEKRKTLDAFQGPGRSVLHTAHDGAVIAEIRNGQLTVTSFLNRESARSTESE